jgi:chorismate synthase
LDVGIERPDPMIGPRAQVVYSAAAAVAVAPLAAFAGKPNMALSGEID